MGGASTKVKESYQVKEGTDELYWGRRWLKKLPPHLFQYETIQKLNLSYNLLSTLPPEISLLSNLTEVVVSNNLMNKLPLELGRLTKLASLDIGQNSFTLFPIEALITLTSLHTLNINNNKYVYSHSISSTALRGTRDRGKA